MQPGSEKAQECGRDIHPVMLHGCLWVCAPADTELLFQHRCPRAVTHKQEFVLRKMASDGQCPDGMPVSCAMNAIQDSCHSLIDTG
jgi:hypothetical protein